MTDDEKILKELESIKKLLALTVVADLKIHSLEFHFWSLLTLIEFRFNNREKDLFHKLLRLVVKTVPNHWVLPFNYQP